MTASISEDARDLVDDMRLDEIEELAKKAISYWVSLREGARRGEPITVATHLRQARLVTFATQMIVKDFGDLERVETKGPQLASGA